MKHEFRSIFAMTQSLIFINQSIGKIQLHFLYKILVVDFHTSGCKISISKNTFELLKIMQNGKSLKTTRWPDYMRKILIIKKKIYIKKIK